MGNTFRDLFQSRDRMLHEHALWTEMRDHLGKFLDGDAAPVTVGIVSKGAGGVVPQDIIMEVQLQIDGTLDQLQREITEIEQIEVAKYEPTAEEKSESETTENRQNGGKKGKKPSEPSAGTK